MDEPISRDASHEECTALARQSGALLMLLSGRLKETDPLAAVIHTDAFVAEVVEDKHHLPVKGLQWLRAIEATAHDFNWYEPSILEEVAVAFQGHVAGVVSSRSNEILASLEARVLRYLAADA